MEYRQEPVAAIIPAFNEEAYIGTVLDVLLAVDQLSEIRVVDDGSTDSTSSVVQDYQARDPRVALHPLTRNLGKGGAMMAGADGAGSDLVLFLDADLIGLRVEHVRALCGPVAGGESDMTLGLFHGGRHQTDLSHRLTPFLSGQRCLRWSLLRDAPEMGQARWGAEVALSLYAWDQNYRVHTVPWEGVTHAMRAEKMRRFGGYLSHIRMWRDIVHYFARYFLFRRLLGTKRRPTPRPAAGRRHRQLSAAANAVQPPYWT